MSQPEFKSNWYTGWFGNLFHAQFIRRIRSSVSGKLIAVIVVVLVVIASIQILFSDRATRQNLENEAQDVLISYYQTYQTKIQAESRASEALALSIASRADVQDLYLRGDRDGLYALLLPMFAQWQDRQIVHLYIENPDGTVFLRVHNPANFGDEITYRETAYEALNEQHVTSGVEIGPSRLGVRGVAPMYSSSGQFIGLAEVGMDFDEQFISNLKATTGADFTMWVSYEAAAVPHLKPAEGAPTSPIEELFYYVSTRSEALPVSPEVYRTVLTTGKPAFQVVAQNTSAPFTVYVTPLLGYNDKVLGLLQISEPYTSHLAAQQSALLTTVAVTSGLTILGLVLMWLFSARVIIQPLNLLAQFAGRQMGGEIGARVSVTSGDEFQQLAETFNALAGSVELERSSLEQRVAARTRNLELAAEVGRAVSQVRDLDVMLREACELILKEFNLYYVQVYLTDFRGSALKLEAGTGHVGAQLLGRGHSLPLDTGSINGRAAVEKSPVVISDTSNSTTFRRNPLLPHTRGEMAVPLLIANKVVGVLDMQSAEPDTLTHETLPAFEALAGQMAVAIQNANLLEEAKQARAEVEKQAARVTRTNWRDYLDAIHKPERIGFVYDQNQVKSLDTTQNQPLESDSSAVAAPISVTGETLGQLVVELDQEKQTERTKELVNIVARLVAQQIEGLRLIESSERYRAEAEEASRRLVREGWEAYQTVASANLGYQYDLRAVRPVAEGEAVQASITLPLKVREEPIGNIAVQGLDSGDTDAVDFMTEVAERLSAHIEGLRQFDETRRSQVELDRRARQLAAVAEISTTSAKELDVQKMLETVVHLTQRKFGLYHAHVFLFNEMTGLLKIAACGWKEGDEHEGTHGTAEIPFDQEQSLVARAARTRQAVIVNDVHNEPGWLPNPLLPGTQAEMAIPLVIGDQVLGVLDVQSDRLNAFTEEDANIQATLASQVATALQNARSFAQAQKQAERETMLNAIGQKIQSATSVEAVLQIAARELGHALSSPMTIAQLSRKRTISTEVGGYVPENEKGNGNRH